MPPKHKQTNDSGWNPWRRSKSRPEGTFVLNLIDAGSSTDINQSIISNKQQQTYAPPVRYQKRDPHISLKCWEEELRDT